MAFLDLDVLIKFPLIFPKENGKEKRYSGYLTVDGEDFEVDIKEVNSKLILESTPQLEPYLNELRTKLNGKESLSQLLETLQNLIGSRRRKRDVDNVTNLYRIVLNEYKDFCEEYQDYCSNISITNDLSEINVGLYDERKRLHKMSVVVKNCNGSVLYITKHDLPDLQSVSNNFSTLRGAYNKFFDQIQNLQNYFDTFDIIDKNFVILDPQKPTRKDNHRRIVLESNVSAVITFDPFNINCVPVIKFLGPKRKTDTYRDILSVNLTKWSPNDEDIASNLLLLFGLSQFPVKSVGGNSDKEEIVLCSSGECCICFSSRFETKLPEIVCSCEVQFHVACLFQWLVALGCRRSFNEIHGKCPNCDKGISCPVVSS